MSNPRQPASNGESEAAKVESSEFFRSPPSPLCCVETHRTRPPRWPHRRRRASCSRTCPRIFEPWAFGSSICGALRLWLPRYGRASPQRHVRRMTRPVATPGRPSTSRSSMRAWSVSTGRAGADTGRSRVRRICSRRSTTRRRRRRSTSCIRTPSTRRSCSRSIRLRTCVSSVEPHTDAAGRRGDAAIRLERLIFGAAARPRRARGRRLDERGRVSSAHRGSRCAAARSPWLGRGSGGDSQGASSSQLSTSS